MFWQLLANGLVTGSVYALAAVGVTLIYGILRLVNFAYGDFMAFGALAAYAFNGPLGLGMLVSTLLGMLATAVLSLGLDFVLWRPLRARRAGFMSLFLASIGLALVLRQALLLASVRSRRPTGSISTRCMCSAACGSRRRSSSRSSWRQSRSLPSDCSSRARRRVA